MRRRDFLALAGIALTQACTALPVRAQQPAKVARIAFLSPPLADQQWDAILAGLADAGYIDGKTMTMVRFTAPTNADLPTFAARAVASKPDIIMTVGGALEAKNATTTIPIVFRASAPVEQGLVASLAHPGGNLTGVSNTAPDIASKQLGFLKEALPFVRRVAILNLPAQTQSITDSLLAAAPRLGMEALSIDFVEGKDFGEQLQRVLLSGVQAVYVNGSAYFNANRDVIYDFEIKMRLPMFNGAFSQPFRDVLGYAVTAAVQYHTMGRMVDAILKGTKPADIPVEQPTAYDLVVNLKTAKALGITIPQSVLVQANEVIQ